MSSSAYFLGAVAMVNSLRLLGHDEPIHLLDLGLTDEERQALAAEATIVEASAETQPWLSKTIAPLAHPAETMILLDTDIIVTRRLDELIERASEGGAIAFENDDERFVPEWAELLDLGAAKRRPYVCSGLVFLGGESGAEALRLLDDRQRRVDFERSYFGVDEPGYALRFLDQDVLNAVLQSSVETERFEVRPFAEAPMPPFEGLRVIDESRLRCAYADGHSPYAVHHFGAKPWLEATHDGVYSQLLRRLLQGPDVAIGVPAAELPLRLRGGPIASAERKRINLGQRLRRRFGGAT
ncbi:MAG: hypothetical protein H0W14_00435, partial [Actinobacteria bacterium]|nr:hypothetical protein [Actinomycetota bacterium]